MKKKRVLSWVVGSICLAGQVHAQPGVPDPSFGTAGRVTLDQIDVADMQVQADQRIVVAGFRLGFDNDIVLARLLPDGGLDSSFGSNGIVLHDLLFNNDRVTSMAIQPDGRILVGGISDFPFVARFNADGSVDATFGTGGYQFMDHPVYFNLEYWSVRVLGENGIILAGSDYAPPDLDGGDYIVFGLLPNGAVDTAFGVAGKAIIDGGIADQLKDVVVQPDGRFILLGSTEVVYNNLGYTELNATLVRCEADGGLDLAFGDTGFVFIRPDPQASYVDANKVIVLPDGGMIISGSNDVFGVQGIDLFVAKCDEEGDLDPSFGVNGIVNLYVDVAPGVGPVSIAMDPQGGFIVNATEWPNGVNVYDAMVLGFSSNGAIDPFFGNAGAVVLDLGLNYDRTRALALQADGKILSCSYESIFGACDIVRLGAQGPVSVREGPEVSALGIMPNPTQGMCRLIGVSGTGPVRVFDALGRVRSQMSISAGDPIVDLSHLSPGTYVIEVVNAMGVFRAKVVRE